MIVSFTSFTREEDFYEFFKFKSKMTKSSNIYIFLCLMFGATAIYNTITTKDLTYLIPLFVFVLIVFLTWYNEAKVKPKKYIKDIKEKDIKVLETPKKVSITQSALEIQTVVSDEETPYIESVFPYSVIVAVYETDKAFYFFVTSSEVKFIMKRDLPKELISDITNILKTHCSNFRTID